MMGSVVQFDQWKPLFPLHSSITLLTLPPCSSLGDHSPRSCDPLLKPFTKEPAATLRYRQGANSYSRARLCNVFSWLPCSSVVDSTSTTCHSYVQTRNQHVRNDEVSRSIWIVGTTFSFIPPPPDSYFRHATPLPVTVPQKTATHCSNHLKRNRLLV